MDQIRCLNSAEGPDWAALQGDCVDVLRQMPASSIDFSIYSIPFLALFVYSESAADLGNSTDREFWTHYEYVVSEKLRVTKPGRMTAVHCSDMPYTKGRDGKIATNAFSDRVREMHEKCGWYFCRRVTIWRDPVVEMTRTKALNLLHKQILKDSCRSWPGCPDYLMIFQAPGDNPDPVRHTPEDFPVDQWQEWASPVWMTVDQTNVLSTKGSKAADDDRHLCPLQLDVIERALIMWSNPQDVVLSPFAGIGSEGVMSLRHKRKFVGVELKDSYWRQQCDFLTGESAQSTMDLSRQDSEKSSRRRPPTAA